MCNLLEYSQHYSMISGGSWNYYRDEIDDVDDNASDGKSFEYKKNSTKTSAQPGNELDGNRPSVPNLNVEVTIPLNMKKNLIYQ